MVCLKRFYFGPSHSSLLIFIALFTISCSLDTKSNHKNGVPKRNGIMEIWMRPLMRKHTTTTTFSTTTKSVISTEEFIIGTGVEDIQTTGTDDIEIKVENSTEIPQTTNAPVSCRCGVFLTAQFKRGSNRPPNGHPVIVFDLPNKLTCNANGQRQCQKKCLESIVSHLPESGKIVCASVEHDCRKERAYLFIQNCEKSWVNTNFAAGREYCCKNGVSYPCSEM